MAKRNPINEIIRAVCSERGISLSGIEHTQSKISTVVRIWYFRDMAALEEIIRRLNLAGYKARRGLSTSIIITK
jgi:hypothetical protein